MMPSRTGHPARIRFAATAAAMLAAALVTSPASAQDALASLGYARGAEHAPVTVVEFGDFGCSACAQFALTGYPPIHEEFVETGRVRWVYVPFLLGVFPNASEAARAAECAAEQGAFWPMHDLLFEHRAEWTEPRRPAARLRGYAIEAGVDGAAYDACYRENRGRARTRANIRAARKHGVRATPTFFVQGRRVEGAPPPELFRRLLLESGAR